MPGLICLYSPFGFGAGRSLGGQDSESLLLLTTASKCWARDWLPSRQPDITFSAQSKYSNLRYSGHSAGWVAVMSFTLQILSAILISLAGGDKFGACSTCNLLRSCLGKLLLSVSSWTMRRTFCPKFSSSSSGVVSVSSMVSCKIAD